MIFKKKPKYEFKVLETSNVIQLDYMGCPLMLCICQCEDGEVRQKWLDVDAEILNDKKIHILEWRKNEKYE